PRGVDLVRSRARFDQVEALPGRSFVSDGHIVGLARSLDFLKGDELAAVERACPLELALGPDTRGFGVAEIGARLLDLLAPRARAQVGELRLGRPQRRLGASDVSGQRLGVETRDELSAGHRLSFADRELDDASGDLGADVDLSGLDGAGDVERAGVAVNTLGQARDGPRTDHGERRECDDPPPSPLHGWGSRMPTFFLSVGNQVRATRWISAAVTARMRAMNVSSSL